MRPKQTSKPHEQEAIELYPLPDSWRWGTVADAGADQKHAIVDGPFGSNLKLSDYVKDGTVPVLTTKNLEGNYDNVRYISKEKFAELKRSAVYPGDILMAKIGSCGKTGIYPPNMPVAMIPANLLKVSLKENFHLRYVYYYFNCSFFQKALKTITKATAQPAFGVTNFRRLPLPVPPLDQQTLIVSEIEKQFSRLDEAVAALKRVRASLKRYKASVLKAAVEGTLTEEKIKWNETTFGKIISISSGDGLTKTQRNDEGEYLVYGGNGIAGRHSEFMYEEEKLIIGRVGVHCGNAYITKPKSWITDNAFVVSFDKKSIDIKFLFHLICFLNLNKYSSSTAQPVISQGKLYPIEISIPEKKEDQQKIVEEIESRLSVAEEIEETIDINLKRAERLRQAVLKKAFSGRIVPAEGSKLSFNVKEK